MLDRSDLQVIEGDARVSCRRLAEVLGYGRANDLHRLIRQRMGELEDFGGVFCFTAKNPSPKGGRPITTYLLNEHQATALCLWAETPKARGARRLIVDVFTAWRRGEMLPPPGRAPGEDRLEALARQVEAVAAQVAALRGVGDATHELTRVLPYTSRRRPDWWSNVEMRRFLTESHRQMTLAQCRVACLARFGTAPSIAGLQRYWAKLDRTFGPAVQKSALRLLPGGRA
jgi:hypothetical protein